MALAFQAQKVESKDPQSKMARETCSTDKLWVWIRASASVPMGEQLRKILDINLECLQDHITTSHICMSQHMKRCTYMYANHNVHIKKKRPIKNPQKMDENEKYPT